MNLFERLDMLGRILFVLWVLLLICWLGSTAINFVRIFHAFGDVPRDALWLASPVSLVLFLTVTGMGFLEDSFRAAILAPIMAGLFHFLSGEWLK